jgi:hypothetical protein
VEVAAMFATVLETSSEIGQSNRRQRMKQTIRLIPQKDPNIFREVEVPEDFKGNLISYHGVLYERGREEFDEEDDPGFECFFRVEVYYAV